MNQINPKDRSMIARMAGNIVGPVLAEMIKDEALKKKKDQKHDELLPVAAQMAVSQAIEILDAIEQRMPCGKCDECESGIRCREIPGEES